MRNSTFKYIFLNLLRKRVILFWMLIFPIVLITSLFLVSGNLNTGDQMEPIQVGVVIETPNPHYSLYDVLSQRAHELSVEKMDESTAQARLKNKEIAAYIKVDYVQASHKNNLTLVVENMKTKETILKSILDHAEKYENIGIRLEQVPPADRHSFIQEVPISSKSGTGNGLILSIFAMLALSCLNAIRMGVNAAAVFEADQSHFAARVAVSGRHKTIILLAPLVLQGLFSTLVVVYAIYVLKIGLSSEFPRVLLMTLIGSASAYFLGTTIGALVKINPNVKGNIASVLNLILSTMAGMMSVDLKYQIDQSVPLLNRINPAAMITDGFYALYYYDDYSRYNLSLLLLVVMGLAMFGITLIALRRRVYDRL